MKLVLWGAGGHGSVVLDAVRQQGLHQVMAFVDDAKRSEDSVHRSGVRIIRFRDNIAQLHAAGVKGVVIAVGDEAKRTELAEIALNAGFELCTIAHPSAVICSDVRIGAGTVIFAGAVVQTGSEIGANVIINTCASIDHDCQIGDGAQLAPRATLGGRVRVGDLTFIGIGATVTNSTEIGRNCVIGAGAVVVRNIPDDILAYGVPARVIRKR